MGSGSANTGADYFQGHSSIILRVPRENDLLSPASKLAIDMAPLLAGLILTAPLSVGDHDFTIQEQDLKRTYILHVPRSCDQDKQAPLVIVLHGKSASGWLAERYTEMGTESDKEGFVAAFPDGTSQIKGWNSGFLNLGAIGVDDVKFIGDVIDDAETKMKIDPKRVFVVGHSSGGMMAYQLGSKLSARIAAIGVVEGTPGFDFKYYKNRVDPPKTPVSALIIHEKDDLLVPYEGGKGLVWGSMSAPDAAAYWAKSDGIDGDPEHPDSRNPDLELSVWHKGNLEVELAAIADGGHEWPGRNRTDGIDAADMLWSFFAAHSRR